MASDTFESALGNSIWVMLKERAQIFLLDNLSGKTLDGRISKLLSIYDKYSKKEAPRDWANFWWCNGSLNRDVWTWAWPTLPHAASLPREHDKSPAYVSFHYSQTKHTYDVTAVYLNSWIKMNEGTEQEHKRRAYARVPEFTLLVYSNLMLPEPTQNVVDDNDYGLGQISLDMDLLCTKIEGCGQEERVKLESIQRKASALRLEIERYAKRKAATR